MKVSGQQVSLADAVGAFLAKTEQDKRAFYQQELGKFMRWYGAGQPVDRLNVRDIDTYVSGIEAQTGSSMDRLEPLKAFLNFSKQQGLTETNLGVHVRVRKPAGRKGRGDTSVAAAERPQRVIHLTPEGFAKLQSELDELIAMRPHIAEELRLAAADKDLRENAPYDAARNHQAQVEARIRELEATIHHAKIIHAEHVDTDTVGVGNTVVVKDLVHGDTARYTLVSAQEVDLRNGKISVVSPIGKALLDRVAGETVEVPVPQGIMRYRIERIEK